MTRGRHANHVHLTTDPADDDQHRPRPPGVVPTLDDAIRTLQTATARTGAQQAAHTLLDQAREQAIAIRPRRLPDAEAPERRLPPRPGRWDSPTARSGWAQPAASPPTSTGRSIDR